SERDVVVGEVVHRRCGRLLGRGLALRALAVAAALILIAVAATAALLARGLLALRAVAAVATTAATFTAAAEHLHLVGDDVGAVLLHAVLAGVLVVAQLALDVDLRALAQVLAGDFAELAEEHHAVPFGALLLVAVAVVAHAGGGQADAGHGHAALGVFHVRVVAAVADQADCVAAAGHVIRSLRCVPGFMPAAAGIRGSRCRRREGTGRGMVATPPSRAHPASFIRRPAPTGWRGNRLRRRAIAGGIRRKRPRRRRTRRGWLPRSPAGRPPGRASPGTAPRGAGATRRPRPRAAALLPPACATPARRPRAAPPAIPSAAAAG